MAAKDQKERRVQFESDDDFRDVEISDYAIKADDSALLAAKKQAKRHAKALRTPEQKRRRTIKIVVISIFTAIVLTIILLLIPVSRWYVLNHLGFRGDVKIIITERTTKKPLRGVSILQRGQPIGTSDRSGIVWLRKIQLGPQMLTTNKSGYSEEKYNITVKPFAENTNNFTTRAIGLRLDVTVKDWLNETPLSDAKIVLGENSVATDDNGLASLIMPPDDNSTLKLRISRPGYLSKIVDIDNKVRDREVRLVSDEKDYFISKREGKLDIYSSNIDGSDQKKIIQATGQEDESLVQLSIRPDNKQAILIANRDGKRHSGRIIAGVYQLDLVNAGLKKIDDATDIEVLGWIDNAVVYRKYIPTTSYDDPSASRIATYNTSTNKLNEVATANYFSFAIVAQKKIFFQPADTYRAIENPNITSLDLSSNQKKFYLVGKQATVVDYSKFNFLRMSMTDGKIYELQINNGMTKEVNTLSSLVTKFSYSSDGSRILWTEQRDGQGALILKSVSGGEDRVISRIGGMTSPVRFVSDNMAIVRILTNQETADYAISLVNGKSIKITDVTNGDRRY